MKVLVLLLAAIACSVADPILYRYDLPKFFDHHVYAPTAPITPLVSGVLPKVALPYYTGIKSQYYDRDLIGQARYGHIEPGQSHSAVQDAFGNKIGHFSYYDAEGKLVQTSYIADAAGYRVTSNNLPVAPTLSPEVEAAKIAHIGGIKIIDRKKRDVLLAPTTHIVSPIVPGIARIIPHAYPTTITKPVVKKDGFLADTPEVTAAKIDHFTSVAAAKFRNLAPHLPIVSPIAPYAPHHLRYVNPYLYY